MEKINNISFEDWVCAKELLLRGLTPQKVYDILNIDEDIWYETDKLWEEKYVELWSELKDKKNAITNPCSYSFSEITEIEIEKDLKENGGILYSSKLDMLEDYSIELPEEGLTLEFLKEQNEDDWLDFIEKNIDNKTENIEEIAEKIKILNEQEYVFYSVNCLDLDMSWGFLDYFNSRSEKLIEDIELHLEIIGAKKYLEIVKQAKPIYQKYKVLDDEDEELEEDIPSKNNDLLYDLEEKLSKLDEKYYKIEEKKSLKEFLLKYVKKNIEKFVK